MVPENNPTEDRYNPPGVASVDFEQTKFGEIDTEELFWQTNLKTENRPWRKTSQTQAMNLKTRTTHNFDASTVIYQKI